MQHVATTAGYCVKRQLLVPTTGEQTKTEQWKKLKAYARWSLHNHCSEPSLKTPQIHPHSSHFVRGTLALISQLSHICASPG